MAKFSTDRTIKEYAEKIWNVEAEDVFTAARERKTKSRT